MEIKDVLNQLPNSNSGWQFVALDHDIKALRWATSRINDGRLNYGIANAFQIMKKNYTVAFPRRYSLRSCDPKNDFKGLRKFAFPLKYRKANLSVNSFDLVYSAGLYDYMLTFPERSKGAIALMANLFRLTKPGGLLVIGNFSPRNPLDLRFSMEYLYDWALIYRNEKEMYRLADGIPKSDIAEMTLHQEPLGINYFLKIVKRG